MMGALSLFLLVLLMSASLTRMIIASQLLQHTTKTMLRIVVLRF